MIHAVLEAIRAKMSSVSFGMDDKVDQLIRKQTVLMVLFGALIIGCNRYFGTPIFCSTTELPSGISQHWIDTLCWISDKKISPIQIVGSERIKTSTSFYQFTVETLILTAVVLCVPGQLWSSVLGKSGYKLKRIATLIAAAKQAVGSQRTRYIEELANHLQITRRYHRLHWTFDQMLRQRLAHLYLLRCCVQCHPRCWYQNRFFIPITYVFIKILYMTTIVFVVYLLEYCLGFNYSHFGLSIINKINSPNKTSTFLDDKFFPQRTWCRIFRTKLGAQDETWADCLLPINVINNVVFSLLWFWLIFIFIISIYGSLRVLFQILPFSTQVYIGHHLQARDLYTMRDNAAILDFIAKCPPDAVLVLRLYEIELGKVFVGEIIGELFLQHKQHYIERDNPLDPQLPTVID